jgi:hypothetical protein
MSGPLGLGLLGSGRKDDSHAREGKLGPPKVTGTSRLNRTHAAPMWREHEVAVVAEVRKIPRQLADDTANFRFGSTSAGLDGSNAR